MTEEDGGAAHGSPGSARTRGQAATPVGSSLAVGLLLSGALHLGLLGLALLDPGHPVRLAFAQAPFEPTVVQLDIVPSEMQDLPGTETVGTAAEVAAAAPAPPPARSRASRPRRPAARTTVATAEAAEPSGELPASPRSQIVAPQSQGAGDEDDDEEEALPSDALASSPAERPSPSGLPPHVPANVAAALRLYDHFPRIPEPLRNQTAEHAMMVDVCVSARGQVSQVNISPSGSELLERTLREAVQTWRYRPLVVGGTPRPFCHMLRVVYRTGSV